MKQSKRLLAMLLVLMLLIGLLPGAALADNSTLDNVTFELEENVVTEVDPPVPESVSLNEIEATIAEGETLQLTATVLPADAPDKSVSWTSSDEAVATVADGLVTAVAAGTATITATTVNGLTATCAVTVESATPYVPEDSTIDLEDATYYVRGTNHYVTLTDAIINAKVVADECKVYENAKTVYVVLDNTVPLNAELTWTYNATDTGSRASHDTTENTVTLVGGQATMHPVFHTYNRGSLVDTVTYTVVICRQDKVVDVTGINISESEITLYVNREGAQFSAAVVPENAFIKMITWESSDPTVALVDQNGSVTPGAAGTATVTARSAADESIFAVCAVTVEFRNPTSITVEPESAELVVSFPQQLTATVLPEDASDGSVTWTSSDETIATVNASGLVTPVAEGTATITASTVNGLTATCAVTVVFRNPTSITVEPESADLVVGYPQQLTVTVLPEDASDRSVTWTSSDETVATVNASGLVTPVAEGTATITASTVNGLTATCAVTVVFNNPTSITLDRTEATINAGETRQLTATVLPENASDKSVTWTSSDEAVATVDKNGLVTAVAEGTATITAKTVNGLEATCAVSIVIPIISDIDLEDRTYLYANVASLKVYTLTGATLNAQIDSYTVNEAAKTVDILLNESVPLDAVLTWTYEGTRESMGNSWNAQMLSNNNTVTLVNGRGEMDPVCVIKIPQGNQNFVTYHVKLVRSDKIIPATGITLDQTELTLYVGGENGQLTATVLPEDADDKSVTWSAADSAVALVDENGSITPVGAGTTTVTASQGELSASCTVTVIYVPVTSITLDREEVTVMVGGNGLFVNATILPENASVKEVTWSLGDDSDFAQLTVSVSKPRQCCINPAVYNHGTPDDTGDTTLTASIGDVSVTIPVHVIYVYAEAITLNKSEVVTTTSSAAEKLSSTFTPERPSNRDCTWTSSDESVATVSSNGTVTPRGEGVATITVASADGPYDTCEFRVYYVDGVIEMIAALPERITRDDADAVNAAKAAYDALNEEAKPFVTNYDKLLAALETLAGFEGTEATRLAAPTLSAADATVGYQTVTLSASAEPADESATLQYRISLDGVNWAVWQDSAEFTDLKPNTTHYYQARVIAGDTMHYLDSEPSAAISLTNQAVSTTTVEVATWEEFQAAVRAVAEEDYAYEETVIRLTASILRPWGERDSLKVTNGKKVVVTAVEGATLRNCAKDGCIIAADAGGVVTLKDLITGFDRKTGTGLNTGVYTGQCYGAQNGGVLNLDNVGVYSAIYYGAVWANNNSVMNVYSGSVINPAFGGDVWFATVQSTGRINVIPYGNVTLEGDPERTNNNIYVKAVTPIAAAYVETTEKGEYTALSDTDVRLMNEGCRFMMKDRNYRGLRIMTVAAAPVSLPAPTVAEEGSEGAENADITYVRGETSITVTLHSRPANSLFLRRISGGRLGSMYHDCWPDEGWGNVYTYSNLDREREYTLEFQFASLDPAYTSSFTTVKIWTAYPAVQLDAPVMTGDAETTDTTVTLTVPASAQDEEATLRYRMSSDGETWGEWQDSPAFEGLAPSTTYWFQAMYVASNDHWADSEASAAAEITTKAKVLDAPVLESGTADVTSITLTAPAASAEDETATVQYRMSADGETWGDWQDEAVFTGLTANTTYYFQARYYAVSAAYQNSAESNTLSLKTLADPNAAAFTVGSVSGAPGSEVQVEISMKNNPGIVAARLELNYDQDKLELVSVTDAGLLPNPTFSNSPAVYPFVLSWDASNSEVNLTDNGLLATATFRIKDDAAEGDSARVWITYDPDDVYDHDLTNVDFDTEEGTVTVEAAPYVPVDSQIDLEDYVLQAMGRDFEKITGATVNALVDSYTEDPETKTVRVILNESVPLDAELTWTFAHEALTDFGIDPEETGLTATLVDGMATMVPTITVLGSAASYTVHFVRSDKIVAAESITLDKTELTFDLEHTTEQLTATVLPENAFDKTVTWTTSDNSVALVDNTGLVKSVSVGTATITAACGELTATCEVTVTEAVYVPVDSQIDLEDFKLYYSGTPFGTVTGATVNAFVDAYSQDGDTVRVVLNKSVPLDAELTWTYNGSTSHPRLVLKDRDNTLTLADGQGTMHPVVDMVQSNNNTTRDSKTLTVIFVRSDKVVAAESVTLDKTSISFDRDHTLEQLTATVLPEETFIKAVTWTSSDESVATVDENGLVRSVAVGSATITAACGDASATCTVSVTVAPYIPTPSQIDLEDRNFEKYGMCPFTMTGATVSDKVDSYTVDEATKTVRVILNEEVPLGAEVTWTYVGDYPSDYSWMNPVLNHSGNVVILEDGCGTMDAALQVNSSSYGDLGSVTYHVIFARSDKVVATTGIELDKTALTLSVNGASEQLTATVLPENAFDKSVTWTTSDENVATVDQTGLVKPVGAGTATITVSQGELKATCAVEVRFVEVTGISLSETEVNLSVGGVGVNVTANLEPENASDKTVTWTLEGEDYARISASGTRCTIYPKAEGDAVLTATAANGQTATCAIHVAYVTVESVVLDRYEVIMSTTGSELVKGSVDPSNASTQTLDWSNDNPDAVSFSVQRMISSGKSSYNCTLSPKAEGTANITVSSPDGPSSTLVVKVYYVADVIDTIDALPERVTRDDADAVNAAKALYDALNDEAKTLVTNADKLQAALDALASFEGTDPATMAAPTLSAESAVVGYQTVTLTATGEPADATATIEYRVSTDGESWSKWQASGEFKNLRPNTTHYYQARFAAGDVVNYLDSEPCEAVAIMNKAPATTTVEVADWTELKNAMQGAATDGTETVIRLTKTVIRNYDLRSDSITVPDGAIIVLTAAEGAKMINAGTNVAFNLRNGSVITIKDMVCANITEADRRGLNSGVYSARLFNSNYAYTANVDNARMISGITYGVFTGSQATVNFYSGVITNPVYDCMNTNDNRPIEGVTRVNLIPYGDLTLEGDLKDVKDKIFFAPIAPISAVFTQTANLGTYTALNAGKVELLNAGGQFPASGIFGIRVLTNGNTAPAPFAELTIAEEGTPEAETADVTYVRSETQMVFTVKNKPANSVFFIKSNSYPYGNGYYYAWPDGGEGNVYTVPGMRSDTAYTIKLMLASLDTAYTNVESVHELRSTYTAVQLNAPVLTDNAAITDTAVTLEAPAASTQDAKAIIKYRMSADGETWGDWQESPVFEGLAPLTAYSFQAMYAAGDDHWSDSEPSNTVTLTTKAKVLDAPVLTEAAADVNSVTVTAPAASAEDASATVQYRISADGETWGDWQDEATFTGLAPKTTYYVQARYYAVSENYQNSEPSQALAVTTEKDPTAPVFAVSSVSGAPGSEVQVEISMANNPGIVAANLELNYDQDKLELVSVTDAGLLPNPTFGNSPAVYPFVLSWDASTFEVNLTDNGLLATATFRIKDEAATGDDAKVWITYDPDNVFDYSMKNVTFDTEEGAVAITDGYAVTLVDRAAEAATTLTSGLYAGELSFTVTNDQACVVLTKDEAGSYTVLRAVPVGDPETTNTYSFTVNVDKPLTVIIAVKGDVDGSGAIGLDDWSYVARSLLTPGIRAHLYLSDEQILIGDLTGEGVVDLEDYGLIARSLLSKTARAYNTIKW